MLGNESTFQSPLKALKDMKNLFIGVDISKEKLNLCFRMLSEVVREEEIPNTTASITKSLEKALKALSIDVSESLVCAEYTGRYIYPLVCTCQNLNLYLWMENPATIKNSLGVTRGKNDTVDARRIAEYAFRFKDKAVAYAMKDESIMSLKNLLSDRDLLVADKVKYQAQLSDQKQFMDKNDYKHKEQRWKKVIKCLQEQINAIEEEMEGIVKSDEHIKHQMDLLTSVDGVGKKLAVNMIVITEGFTRFQNARQFNCYAGLAPFQYTSGKSIYSKSKVSHKANKHIKSLLHLCAVAASTVKKDGDCREYYERKKLEGKHPMCVLNVVRAKLVSRMFAVIRRDSPYTDDFCRAAS